MNLGHHYKPSINLPEDMDNHCRLPCAFYQLEDADVVLVQPVVADKLDPTAAVETSFVAPIVIPDRPLLFPLWSEELNVMGSSLKVVCSKSSVDDLHCIGMNWFSTDCIVNKCRNILQTPATKFTVLNTDYVNLSKRYF